MEPEQVQLCIYYTGFVLDSPRIAIDPSFAYWPTLAGMRASSSSCASCQVLLSVFEICKSRALARFKHLDESAAENSPLQIILECAQVLPSGLRVLHIWANLSLPNQFIPQSRLTLASCQAGSCTILAHITVQQTLTSGLLCSILRRASQLERVPEER